MTLECSLTFNHHLPIWEHLSTLSHTASKLTSMVDSSLDLMFGLFNGGGGGLSLPCTIQGATWTPPRSFHGHYCQPLGPSRFWGAGETGRACHVHLGNCHISTKA